VWSCNGGANQRFGVTDAGEITFGGQCLDVVTGDMSNGRNIQLYPCKSLSRTDKYNQLWHLTGAVTGLAGNCLDIRGGTPAGADYTPVQTYTCNGGANQQWDYYFMP
jgi:hypothetical protein